MAESLEAEFVADMQGGYGDPASLPEGSRGALDALRVQMHGANVADLLSRLPLCMIYEGSVEGREAPATEQTA